MIVTNCDLTQFFTNVIFVENLVLLLFCCCCFAVVVVVVVAVVVAVAVVVVVVAQRTGASEGDVICFHTRLQLQRDVVQ